MTKRKEKKKKKKKEKYIKTQPEALDMHPFNSKTEEKAFN